MSNTALFRDVVRARQSVRSFRPEPVPETLIKSVLADAQCAPSNCNTQPWQVHVLSGEVRDAFSAAMLVDEEGDRMTLDFSFAVADYPGLYNQRAKDQGAAYYQAIGVQRHEYEARRTAARHNLAFFGAPHAALLFMPAVGDNVRVAADIGMYAQTFLLSLTAHGLGGIPQTYLGHFADTARRVIGIDPSLKLLFGISFGYPDPTAAANRYRIGKAPIEQNVVLHG